MSKSLLVLILFVAGFYGQMSQAVSGRCLPHDPYDQTSIKVCNTQYGSQAGCQSQGYFCKWVVEARGRCVAHNPFDQTAVNVCDSQIYNQAGCQGQSYFCSWRE